MLHKFFEIQNNTYFRDDFGTKCSDLQSVAPEAKKLLLAVERDDGPKDGEHRAVTELVTNEDGCAVYSATLTYKGLCLLR